MKREPTNRPTAPDWEQAAALVRKAGLLDVDAICSRLKYDRTGWHRVEWMRLGVQRNALWLLAAELRAEKGLTNWDAAVGEAAARLGFNEDSVSRRVRSDRALSRGDGLSGDVVSLHRRGKVA